MHKNNSMASSEILYEEVNELNFYLGYHMEFNN